MPAVWPPRLFDFQSFPPLDAVVISHEHEDHFNLPSLNLLDRSVPVLLSGRSSVAARTVLAEMGFSTELLIPGEGREIGSLQLMAFSPDHLATFNCEEWDGLALLIRDDIDGGCFFTTVDLMPTVDMIERVTAAMRGAKQVLVHMDNRLGWVTGGYLQELVSVERGKTRTENIMGIEEIDQGKPILAVPGNTISVSANSIDGVDQRTDFLQTPPRDSWPPRPGFHYYASDGNYSPACGESKLSDSDADELFVSLQHLAEFLYGSPLYKRLYSLTCDLDHPWQLTFALLLIADAQRNYFVLEYQPTACAFTTVSVENPFQQYVSGVECWGTDLLAVFHGDFEPRILSRGRSRYWTHDALMPDPFIHLFWPFFHPQRRPMQCLSGYRSQLCSLDVGDIRILRNRQ